MKTLIINSATAIKDGETFGEMELSVSECGNHILVDNYTFCDTAGDDISMLDVKNSDLLDTYLDRKGISLQQGVEAVIKAMDDTTGVYKIDSFTGVNLEYYYWLDDNALQSFIKQLRKLVGELINDKAPKVVAASKFIGNNGVHTELKFVIADDYTAVSEHGYIYEIVRDEKDLAAGVFEVYQSECGLYFNYNEDGEIQDHTDDTDKSMFAMAFMEKTTYNRMKTENADLIDSVGEAIDECGMFNVTFFDDEVDNYFDFFVNDDFAWYAINIK
jgi:hypothetical protein